MIDNPRIGDRRLDGFFVEQIGRHDRYWESRDIRAGFGRSRRDPNVVLPETEPFHEVAADKTCRSGYEHLGAIRRLSRTYGRVPIVAAPLISPLDQRDGALGVGSVSDPRALALDRSLELHQHLAEAAMEVGRPSRFVEGVFGADTAAQGANRRNNNFIFTCLVDPNLATLAGDLDIGARLVDPRQPHLDRYIAGNGAIAKARFGAAFRIVDIRKRRERPDQDVEIIEVMNAHVRQHAAGI